jgi:hypothetical protein
VCVLIFFSFGLVSPLSGNSCYKPIRCSRRIRWQPTGLTHRLLDATCWTLLFLCRLGGQHVLVFAIHKSLYLLFLIISKDFFFFLEINWFFLLLIK